MQANQYHIQGPQINQFTNVTADRKPRSLFKRDFTLRTTFNQNYLIPLMVDEILPGDDISLRMHSLIRLSTPVKPIMDNLYLDTFGFFVPNRLVWDNWEKFQGQQSSPGDSVAYTIPKLNPATAPINTTGFQPQTIYDYFGLPTLVTNLDNINALFNRAYEFIWNEWFRDENLQSSIAIVTGDGPDAANAYQLRIRNKRKDYFTSCTPWPQKGTAVTIPLGGTIPVSITGVTTGAPVNLVNSPLLMEYASAVPTQGGRLVSGASFSSGATFNSKMATTLNATGDLSAATQITVNAFRQAALYQQILELDARGGTRYVESLYSRFGVISPDFRLQRPELIGQGSTRFNVFPVPQTAQTDPAGTPQGNLAAFGTHYNNGEHGCRYTATEHGMLFFLANVRADLTYQQGIPKMFSRRTRLDYYEPQLNGLGEQAVLNKEIYAQGTAADELAFGYQERFAEYRWRNSQISGKFRSTDPQSLDVWHLSQEFGSLPPLNASFIQENIPMDRVLAVNTSTEPAFIMDANFSYNHVRVMPTRSNPGIDKV